MHPGLIERTHVDLLPGRVDSKVRPALVEGQLADRRRAPGELCDRRRAVQLETS